MENVIQEVREPNQIQLSTKEKVFGVIKKIDKIIGIVLKVLFRLRKVFLAAPVVYAAVKLAAYNREHLPQVVGLDLQASGFFAQTISQEMAIMAPLVVTGACLVLMFFSKKALYPWAISVFSLALPILLLISNRYPA